MPVRFAICWNFNPRSPHGERPHKCDKFAIQVCISTHAPRTGSDLAVLVQQTVRDSFQPTLPARGATGDWIPVRRIDKRFQPTLPARGATLTSTKPLTTQNPISTHAPRTGSDAGTIPCSSSKDYFNPRSPHGERPACSPLVTISNSFQPTLPARGATVAVCLILCRSIFQPTLPARGATWAARQRREVKRNISTHAPRTGSDMRALQTASSTKFQPTLPARGATGASAQAMQAR